MEQTGDTHRRPRAARVRTLGPKALLPAVLLAAVAASSAVSASLAEPPVSDVEQQLDAEIEGMVDAGVPADDPKVEMLEEQLDELADGNGAPARREPGVDTGARLTEAEQVTDAQARAEAAAGAAAGAVQPRAAGGAPAASTAAGTPAAAAADGRRWESGIVACEPLPGLLTMGEVAGATCLSVPQPDGTSRYVALAADGTVRSVRFGTDGAVQRMPDERARHRGPAGRGGHRHRGRRPPPRASRSGRHHRRPALIARPEPPVAGARARPMLPRLAAGAGAGWGRGRSAWCTTGP